MKQISALVALVAAFLMITQWAWYPWSNRYLFNRAALEALPELASAPKVKVEKLEDFLLKEQAGLAAAMAQIEAEAKEISKKI